MEKNFNLEKVNNYLKYKLETESDIIICTYYEMKFEMNISKKDENTFLKIARKEFEKRGYDVYFTNAKYKYDNRQKVVNTNEALVAIKNIF